jgi:branched-chain amino acid transport system ATP-binding protein
MTNCLRLKAITVYYGKARAIRDVSADVSIGSVTGIIGANGAGKSTIMRAISGMLTTSSGEIWFYNERIDRLEAHRIVSLGIVQVPEGRRLFPYMSVLANIKTGAYLRNDSTGIKNDMQDIFRRFPILLKRQNQRAETLSGGEQQMLAIARALMAHPRVLLMDEPSWGLAPLVVEGLIATIKDINRKGITILLVEQNARLALALTNYVYVLEVGEMVLAGNPKEIMNDEIVHKAFLG